MKPTNGLIPPRDRAGLNVGGPLARCAADAAAYLAVTTGRHVRRQQLPTQPMRAVWSPALGFAETDPGVADVAAAALQRLVATGLVELVDIPLRLHDPAAAWQGLRAGTVDDEARALRRDNDHRLAEAFANVDLIATPTTPIEPHPHTGPGEAMSVALTWAFNLSGHPAISLPAGRTPTGAPVGLQLVARHRADGLLLALAQAIHR